jgi:two-component system sensor histidine kinase ChvG
LDQRGRLRGHIRFNRRRDEIGDLSRSLEEMTLKLRDHIEFVESFASDISHEFRNPLASIRSAAEMIGRIKSVAERDRFLHLIQKEVGRMQHLLGAVREISLIDARLGDEERSSVEVAQVLKQVVEAYKLRVAPSIPVEILEHGASFSVSIAPGRLSQVLENLLDNALGFASSQVRIRLFRDRGFGIIVFQDDGPGIPDQHMERIFDRFFSYRDTTTSSENMEPREEHLGLGLAIVKAIVQGYGGSIAAGNGPESGTGACFTVSLPLAG